MFEKDPRTFSPEYKNLSPEQKAMVKLEITLSNFFKNFDKSLSRWERLVYPMLAVAGLLGLSGFYLIYNVTKDMHILSEHVDPKMEVNLDSMSQNMAQLAGNIDTMTKQITILVSHVDKMESHLTNMDQNIGEINTNIEQMNKHMGAMTTSVVDMNQAIRHMTFNTSIMSRDINDIGRPMNFMNSFTPW